MSVYTHAHTIKHKQTIILIAVLYSQQCMLSVVLVVASHVINNISLPTRTVVYKQTEQLVVNMCTIYACVQLWIS